MKTTQELKEQLLRATVEVKFTKVNGEERVMNCTLQADLIPASTSANTAIKAVNPDVTSVWDVDKQGWRSFRNESVISTRQLLVE